MKRETRSTWQATLSASSFPSLSKNASTEVCIIGGGLTGVLSAYLLARGGVEVALLEEDRLGSGATGLTTAFLTQALDTDLVDLKAMFGVERARRILEGHGEAIDLIEDIAHEEKIECEFKRDSVLLYGRGEKEMEGLRREYEAAYELGCIVEWSETPAKGFRNRGFLKFTNQGKYHPLKFLHGLAQKAAESGVKIYEKTKAERIETDGTSTLFVRTDGHTLEADRVISATYGPWSDSPGLFFKKGMYTTYVFELHTKSGAIPEGLYEDTYNPYHYFRVDPQEGFDRMIVGGEDHRADIHMNPEKNFHALEDFVRDTFPKLDYRIIRAWRGPILEPVDGLAFIGPYGDPRILFAFGFSGTGMTYAGIASMILSDSILGKKNPWSEIFRTSRMPPPKPLLIKGRDYIGELAGGALKNSYKYFGE